MSTTRSYLIIKHSIFLILFFFLFFCVNLESLLQQYHISPIKGTYCNAPLIGKIELH
uniref:Uncharacterized protein n=1 Tax=Lepeophtheirus salmonis TaxID=72036 RepID=A0A0K2UVE6_LEPSM